MARSVLVTGGARGIGYAVATAFARAGDAVSVTYRGSEPPDGPPGWSWVSCDVKDGDSVDAAFSTVEQRQGPVEVLVANAGITRDGLMFRMSEDDFLDVIDTNLNGAFRVARRALAGMAELRRGRVVFLSSIAGSVGSAGQVNYAASKAGLVGMARSMARELGTRGVTVNVVAPGLIATDMTASLVGERRERLLAQVPLARMGSVEDVAAVVGWLASDAASYVTGAVLPVDGGLGMGH
jgi:3-oxoacyl-[acyl-carrier protein] reductase